MVALVDSGVALRHPQLLRSLRSRGVAFGDCQAGAESVCEQLSAQDELGHGTRMAGLLLESAPGVLVQPYKVNAGQWDEPSARAVAQAIRHAIRSGTHIINLSLSLQDSSDSEQREVAAAIEEAQAQGLWVVAAGGNGGQGLEFPATLPGVLAVGGVGQAGLPLNKQGAAHVLLAPAEGLSVLEIDPTGPRGRASGSSVAAPLVAGTLARMRSLRPQLSWVAALEVLGSTATPPGSTGSNGQGRVLNADRAVLAVAPGGVCEAY